MDSPIETTLGSRLQQFLSSALDYKKERKRINKRLLSLRHDLNIINSDTKNYKKRKHIISAQDYTEDSRYGLLLLLTAERDSLYALEIKSLMETGRSNSYKALMISKLKRAVQSMKSLLDVSFTENDDKSVVLTRLELYAYTAILQGQLSINKKNWSKALHAWSIAKCTLEFLIDDIIAESIASSTDDDYKKSLFAEVLDTLVDPSLKLVLSQDEAKAITSDIKTASRKHCHDDYVPYLNSAVRIIESIDSKYLEDLLSKIDLIKTITWRDHSALLYNDEIALKIMNIQNTSDFTKKDFTDDWLEILQLHISDCEKYQDDDDDENVQNRAITLTFIKYNLSFAKIKYHSHLIKNDDKKSLELFSLIISFISEIKELPGVYNDDELLHSLSNLEFYYFGLKLFVLSKTLVRNHKYVESLAIYNHLSEKLAELEVGEKAYQVEFPFNLTNNDEFKRLQNDIEEKLLQSRILIQFDSELNQGDNYIVENLNKFPSSKAKVINLSEKPNIYPILSKPVLFDLGFNYIDYDVKKQASEASSASVSKTSESKEQEESNKKRGFFGIFGGR